MIKDELELEGPAPVCKGEWEDEAIRETNDNLEEDSEKQGGRGKRKWTLWRSATACTLQRKGKGHNPLSPRKQNMNKLLLLLIQILLYIKHMKI
jgi:hypothetical protein